MKTPPNRTATDDEIEAEVLAKRSNPEAWETLAFVPASRSPRPAWMLRGRHLELAAKFHILYLLHLLGVEANLALSQPDSVDITVLREGGHAFTLDVKVVAGAESWYVDRFTARKHHFIVFVGFGEEVFHSKTSPDVYITPSEALYNFVERERLEAVPLELLEREFHALDAWGQLLTEPAS